LDRPSHILLPKSEKAYLCQGPTQLTSPYMWVPELYLQQQTAHHCFSPQRSNSPRLRNSESSPSPETIRRQRGRGEMAPKKKLPASKQKPKASSSSSAAPAAPRLQISSENERRLRRLLLNSSTTAVPAQAPSEGQAVRSESREQKSRRLRGVYDKLALEGFSSAQIEQALSALSVRIPEQIYNVVTGRN
jgi:hypothetical protein